MKLVSALAVVLMAGFVTCSVKAQVNVNGVPSLTSQNLITPSVNSWVGSVPGQNGGFSGGGNGPAFNATTDTLIFGYTTKTATQTMSAEAFAIQHALNLSNSGIKIQGYNYSWKINNSGDQSGTLSGKVELMRGTTALETYNYNYDATTNSFELKNGTQAFASEYSMLAGDAMRLSFTGKDSRFWAGYYGPQVREPSLSLNYTVDPCAMNPAYSPSCPGYNTVVISPNLLTGMTGTQAYAINQALSNAGAGAMIHGFNYGYNYSVAGRYCAVLDLFGLCLTGWQYSDAGVSTVITDSSNSTIYSESIAHNGGDNGTSGTYSKEFRFGTSRQITTLGGFAMAPWTSGNASITNMYSNAVYTADPCLDPLSSPSCPGYAAAYLTQQCSANPLYNSACPGYAEALFNQQCTATPLIYPSCPGYASAYLTYQCSINPLYSTTCPGYEQAYLNDQCIKDSLYSTKCEGYATAYAIKYLTPISSDSTVANAVNGSLSDTAAVKATDPANTKVAVNTVTTTVSADGTVSTGVSKTGDTNVDKVITSPTSTTNSAAAPTAPVQLAPVPNPETRKPPEQKEQRAEKKEDVPQGERQVRKNEDGPSAERTQQMAQGQQSNERPAGPTVRDALVEKRQAAARAEAIEKGKNLANQIGKVADMEQLKQVQNVVIQAMGFTPGFDTYGKTMLPDGVGYKPFTVYNNQKTVDNARLGRGLFGPTDRLHTKLVELQYLGE